MDLIIFTLLSVSADGPAPSETAFWEMKEVQHVGDLMFNFTYWSGNDSWYFHIGKRNIGYKTISRQSFTLQEGKEAMLFLNKVKTQINEAKKGELLPMFEGSMEAATMSKKDGTFWDESPYCFRSVGLVIRVTFYKRTGNYLIYFLKPNYNDQYDKWIGSCFVVGLPQLKDIMNYMKKKIRG